MELSRKNIQKLARAHVDQIVRSVKENKSSLIVEIHRFDRDRVRNRIECIKDLQRAIDQEVWCQVIELKDSRSDRVGWVLF